MDARPLDLAKGMMIRVGRIGYPDEGIRLTIAMGMPFEFDSEVKLSQGDARWLIERLKVELKRKDSPPPKGQS